MSRLLAAALLVGLASGCAHAPAHGPAALDLQAPTVPLGRSC
jgi:hypothetical protein